MLVYGSETKIKKKAVPKTAFFTRFFIKD